MRRFLQSFVLALLALLIPCCAVAQSDDNLSLGDLARAVRRSKQQPAAPAIIDNDNFAQVMDQVETRRLNGSMSFTFNPAAKNFDIKVPDATCSLSFNANAAALLTDPYVPVEMPQTELAKLDGPAILDGHTLQVSVYNGTGWDLNEIIVSLTMVRVPEDSAAYLIGGAKLVPAMQVEPTEEKRSDMTILLHLKGRATPFTTAVFREKLEEPPGPDQDWHWAIVQARGVPPIPASPAPGY